LTRKLLLSSLNKLRRLPTWLAWPLKQTQSQMRLPSSPFSKT